DREVRVLSAQGQVEADEQGRVARMFGTDQDITELVQAEAALQESEARLRAILDNSPGVIFLKDTRGRYLDVNLPFERLFGFSRDQLLGQTDEKIFPPEQAELFRANDRQVIRAGAALHFEETARYRDGMHTN